MTAIVVSGGVFACVGGAGPLSDAMTTWDPSPSSLERADDAREPAPGFREVAPPSREPVGASAEPGPGAQGGGGAGAGGFDCSGTYSCVEAGDDDVVQVTFTSVNGVCTVAAGKTLLVLGPDGSLLVNGKSAGSWQATPGGLVVSTEDGIVTCTKGGASPGGGQGQGTGGGTGGGTGSGSSGPSQGSGGGTATPIPRDAG